VRVTPSLDTINSFEICNPPVDSFIQSEPSVAFAGDNYLVVWSDEKYGPSNRYHPFAARVTPEGVVLDSGVKLSTSSVAEYRPNVADDGSRSLVVWSGSSRGCYGRFVKRDGMPEGDVITIAPGTASGPNLCFGDSCYLVVWHEGTYPALELYGSLVSRQGELIGSTISIATDSGCQRWAVPAFDGTNFLVVWMSGENNVPESIIGQFIAQDGSLVGPRLTISSTPSTYRWWPALAFSDQNCLVAWEQGSSRDVWGNMNILVTGLSEQTEPSSLAVPLSGTILSASGPELETDTNLVFNALGRKVHTNGIGPGVYYLVGPGSTMPTRTLVVR
jgi:hypothetical protein